ncbi:uncharacterized protein LOC123542500 isoform X1 [Mercenaria mercenaria]|uniref:uncharacterized protein LOC123542500 isoform X1 n=1 Tax=Mercenaria mercenaria TaxID=6596 RepID=UPI00234F5853|nr:uncharacterized protein LOC123542500 isoform X1 [Mercenaria mercenaria]XP_053395183.1 uncharacterized protein LOC123542500 isoform X1 [Mercenaria mercenaria]XP_053395184.1 uncharacterized protein LOC123542500 isoform X1 [Mercenaria mercenaria]XP_053395185.1 uncharacterized protein LOC123542500 isoform X1 [Mercenaria mercenaria]XP_053395186.1 uncharacterized protein LOC123542500 isoform X1 [Mercenaria mercenaria]XP_053395187.1 uncharacterized protein LOC123542500 isoform X1 [Mercenaria merce
MDELYVLKSQPKRNNQISSRRTDDETPCTVPAVLNYKATHIVTPINSDKLRYWLQGYDLKLTEYLVNGFKQGFKIPFTGTHHNTFPGNLKSATENLEVLKLKIAVEIDAGRVAGPFNEPPFSNFMISPLGLVPKQEPGEFRVIHHLSFPEGQSVNAGIPSELCSVQYQNIDDAVELVKTIGPGALLSKIDVQNAFKIIPIAPHNHFLLGFCIDNKYYYDKTLPMGLSFSCSLFEQFSSAIHWIAENKLQIPGCAHILDDFLFVSSQDYDTALNNLTHFLDFAKQIGLPLKTQKTVLPCTTICFVGIELDSVAMEKRLPLSKLQKIRVALDTFQNRRRATLKELQSLIGLLSYACSVVTPGRTFLRRLIDLTLGLKKPHHKRRLTKEARADLKAWSIFVEHFNGKCLFFSDRWVDSTVLCLYTDSSNIGFGGYLGNYWFAEEWPKTWYNLHISLKELFPIVLALEFWAPKMQNKCINFFCDNIAVVGLINKQTSRDPNIMCLVRRLVLQCLKKNILFKATHLPGVTNVLADKLSRLQIDDFLEMCKYQPLKRQHVTKDSFTI